MKYIFIAESVIDRYYIITSVSHLRLNKMPRSVAKQSKTYSLNECVCVEPDVAAPVQVPVVYQRPIPYFPVNPILLMTPNPPAIIRKPRRPHRGAGQSRPVPQGIVKVLFQ